MKSVFFDKYYPIKDVLWRNTLIAKDVVLKNAILTKGNGLSVMEEHAHAIKFCEPSPITVPYMHTSHVGSVCLSNGYGIQFIHTMF